MRCIAPAKLSRVFAKDDLLLHQDRRVEIHLQIAHARRAARQLDAKLLPGVRLKIGGVTPQFVLLEGLLVHGPVAWTDEFRGAEEISEKNAAAEGQRTIDLLHVALALECGAKTFLSFGTRQRKLAKAAGLKVKP